MKTTMSRSEGRTRLAALAAGVALMGLLSGCGGSDADVSDTTMQAAREKAALQTAMKINAEAAGRVKGERTPVPSK
jgi:predicted component of type VI protein secretion system